MKVELNLEEVKGMLELYQEKVMALEKRVIDLEKYLPAENLPELPMSGEKGWFVPALHIADLTHQSWYRCLEVDGRAVSCEFDGIKQRFIRDDRREFPIDTFKMVKFVC